MVRILLGILVLAAFAVVISQQGADARASLEILRQTHPLTAPICLLGLSAAFIARSRALAAFTEPTPFRYKSKEALVTVLAGFGLSIVIPGSVGLGVAPLLAARAESVGSSKRYGLGLGGCLVLAELSGFGLITSLIVPHYSLAIAGLTISFGFLGLLFVCLFAPRRIEHGIGHLGELVPPLRKACQRISQGFSHFPDHVTTPGAAVRTILWAMLYNVAIVASLFLLTLQMVPGAEPLETLRGGVFTTTLATVLSPTPQGIGIADGLGGLAFASTTNGSTATAILVLWRILSLWLPLLISIPALQSLGMIPKFQLHRD